jgi:cytochrome c6
MLTDGGRGLGVPGGRPAEEKVPPGPASKTEESNMRPWLMTLILIAATPAFAATGEVAAGKAIYAKHCAMCHGPNGEGKEAIAKMYKVKMAALGSKEVQAKKDADLSKDITEGVGKMRPVKGLSEKEVTDLIAYIRSMKEK